MVVYRLQALPSLISLWIDLALALDFAKVAITYRDRETTKEQPFLKGPASVAHPKLTFTDVNTIFPFV